jgi:quinoprotein glucose dehydrogenase
MRRLWLLVAAAALLVPSLSARQDRATPAPTPPAPGDWPSYNRDLSGTRHSPLTQVTPENVARLRRAWSFPVGKDQTAGSLTGGMEYTPLVVGGLMYVLTSDAAVALEPETGKPVWRYAVQGGAPSRRGMGYWTGATGPRVYFTSGRRLIALDARTGAPAAGFGSAGIADMGRPYNGSVTVHKDMLLVGTNAPPGAVRAFDARTGVELWEFRSVARQPGEPGFDTWGGGSAPGATGAISWAFSMTLDAPRNTLYAVFDSPTPDYYGGARHGHNLYANSIVALDADTGRYRWHFQTTHHDIWDYDIPQPPVLLDVSIDGRPTPILTLAHKTGYMYILHRETGRPVFGIEERPVPASDVPGEQASPTQPIPVKPLPLARVSYRAEDIVTAEDTNAEHAQFCRALAERSGGLHNAGPFTPYRHRAPGAPPRSTVLFPGSIGGANWGGSAVDPALGYVFVNTNDEGSIGWMERRTGRDGRETYARNSIVGSTSRFQWSEGTADGGGNLIGSGEKAWPCQRPPWGSLVAVNARTGDIAWRVPLGTTADLPAGKQRTGRLNLGGPITTASGLVFIGATNDRRFRAFASRTGAELWTTTLDMSAHAVPITYLGRDGKQYVAIVAGGRSALDDEAPDGADALVAFTLP